MAKFFDNILRSLMGAPKKDLPTVQTPSSNQAVAVANAQSWNPETHPEGRNNSYLVDDIDYDTDNGLTVTYRDGFKAHYDGITPTEAKEFAQADSKGRWALKHLWGRPYTEVQ